MKQHHCFGEAKKEIKLQKQIGMTIAKKGKVKKVEVYERGDRQKLSKTDKCMAWMLFFHRKMHSNAQIRSHNNTKTKSRRLLLGSHNIVKCY